MEHKAGFVSIIGEPNVGKSTLLNALLGEKLSIISPKAQTTRHRILGILNSDEYQVVFSDTPGIVKPNYKMQENMMEYVNQALIDADVFIFVVDANHLTERVPIPQKLTETKQPVLLVLNKIDLLSQDEVLIKQEEWKNHFPKAVPILVSAIKSFNVARIMVELIQLLPEHPAYYPKDEMSDRNIRFFVSEIIREKIFLFYHQEIPYSCEVQIDAFQEKEKITVISAIIYVSRESQKGILIGNGGKALKNLGVEARRDIEKFLDTKIYLELLVKVSDDWRNNEDQLKRFGY